MDKDINLESSYDARQRFFAEWQTDEQILRELIVKKQYERYLEVLVNSVCRLPLDVRKNIGDYENTYEEIIKLIEKLHTHDSFNNQIFMKEAERIQRVLFIKLMQFRIRIIDSMQNSKLLLPLNVGELDDNNLKVVADAWRRNK